MLTNQIVINERDVIGTMRNAVQNGYNVQIKINGSYMRVKWEPRFYIYNPKEKLFWSNSMGWVDKSIATEFTQKEKKKFGLPIGGEWYINSILWDGADIDSMGRMIIQGQVRNICWDCGKYFDNSLPLPYEEGQKLYLKCKHCGAVNHE